MSSKRIKSEFTSLSTTPGTTTRNSSSFSSPSSLTARGFHLLSLLREEDSVTFISFLEDNKVCEREDPSSFTFFSFCNDINIITSRYLEIKRKEALSRYCHQPWIIFTPSSLDDERQIKCTPSLGKYLFTQYLPSLSLFIT